MNTDANASAKIGNKSVNTNASSMMEIACHLVTHTNTLAFFRYADYDSRSRRTRETKDRRDAKTSENHHSVTDLKTVTDSVPTHMLILYRVK